MSSFSGGLAAEHAPVDVQTPREGAAALLRHFQARMSCGLTSGRAKN